MSRALVRSSLEKVVVRRILSVGDRKVEEQREQCPCYPQISCSPLHRRQQIKLTATEHGQEKFRYMYLLKVDILCAAAR